MKVVFVFLFALTAAFSARAGSDLETVPFVDPGLYLGTWYRISGNPTPFESGCVCSRQVLGAANDGRVSVHNSCNDKTVNGALREIRGFATNDDPSTNARFTVDFNLPRKGQYWIIGLDPQYRFAVVSEPTRKTLYVLSKTPTLAPELYAEALRQAARQVDTSKLEMTLQNGCSYPN